MKGSIFQWKKLVTLLIVLIVVLLLSLIGFGWYSGAWRVLFPSHAHDEQPPALQKDLGSPAVLVFSKTNSFRHTSGIDGGNKVLKEIATTNHWEIFTTENGAVFNERDLPRFDAVVFLNTSGDTLNQNQEQVFQKWLEAGGGWIGIHAAGDGSHQDWAWYVDNLIGANFTAHTVGPQFQTATVVMETLAHPVAQRFPGSWSHTDEWYSWEHSPRANGFNILATVDETSYSAKLKFLGLEKDLRMGDHPIVWSNCVGSGRTLYTALGHSAEAFDNADYRLLLENALYWVMRIRGKQCQL